MNKKTIRKKEMALEAYLKSYVGQLLSEEGPYGDFLFGQDRAKPNATTPEKDTPEEEELKSSVKDHHFGSMDDLAMRAPGLLALKKKGEYLDVLAPPNGYAVRFLFNIDAKTLSQMTGETLLHTDEAESVSGGVFIPKGRPHASWSLFTDKSKLLELSNNLNLMGINEGTFMVLCICKIEDNKDKFIFNPDEITKIPDLQRFGDTEREVVSVGRIRCERIIYMSYTDENFGDNRNVTKQILEKF